MQSCWRQKEQPLLAKDAHHAHNWSIRVSPRTIRSRTIISDEGDAPLFAVWMDTIMMVCFSAWERNKTQWLKLFDDAGFDLVKLWEPKQVTVGGGFVFELKHKETSLPSR